MQVVGEQRKCREPGMLTQDARRAVDEEQIDVLQVFPRVAGLPLEILLTHTDGFERGVADVDQLAELLPGQPVAQAVGELPLALERDHRPGISNRRKTMANHSVEVPLPHSTIRDGRSRSTRPASGAAGRVTTPTRGSVWHRPVDTREGVDVLERFELAIGEQ